MSFYNNRITLQYRPPLISGQKSKFNLLVEMTHAHRSSLANVMIELNDENDNIPVFQGGSVVVDVKEDVPGECWVVVGVGGGS